MELLELNDHYHKKSGRNIGTDKEWRHKYCSTFYEEAFLPYKDKPVTLLEIGTGQGGGLLLWNDYFTQGEIYGLDVNDYTENCHKDYPRIHTALINAYDSQTADSLPGFDIVIDDGPHTKESQIAAIQLYLPKVKKDGIFVIEDIPELSWAEDYKQYVPEGYKSEIVDTRNIANLFDNIMFIVWK